jgi:acyl carrier protein phosphodiesterase
MIEDNWLLSYASIEGIQQVLNGMNRRTNGKSQMNKATTELIEYYNDFEFDFTTFFEELVNFSNKKRLELEKQFNI